MKLLTSTHLNPKKIYVKTTTVKQKNVFNLNYSNENTRALNHEKVFMKQCFNNFIIFCKI